MKPMDNKSPEMKIAIETLFPGTMSAIDKGLCPCCRNPIGEFRDALSRKEFGISGMCQKCQDNVFGSDE